jgi:hypothetical protein
LTKGDEPYNYSLFFKRRTGRQGEKKLIARGYAITKVRQRIIHLPVDWYDDSMPSI